MERIDRIVHQIYEAADDPEYWPDVGSDIADCVDGGAVHLLLASLRTGEEYINLFQRGDPGFASEYLQHYAGLDFRVPRVMARRLGTFLDEREYVSEGEARASAIHQELLPRYAVHKISGANMSLEGCIGWFGVSTRRPSDEFDDRQRRLLARLSAHLLRAFRIARSTRELQVSRDLGRQAADLVSAALFIHRHGRVALMNAAAERMLAGGFLVLRGEQLVCTHPGEQARLSRFMQDRADDPARDFAQGGSEATLLLRNHEDGAAYMVRSHALPADGARGGGTGGFCGAISIVEPAPPAGPSLGDVLGFCSAYGVTRAEGMAVHAVLNSISLADFAAIRGVRLDTVQQQLKSAMSKMELASQKKIFQAFERYRVFGE